MKEKSLGYTLFVDEETDNLFHVFCGLFEDLDEIIKTSSHAKDPKALRMRESFGTFLESITDKSHENGWCKDPTCTWVPKEQRNGSK